MTQTDTQSTSDNAENPTSNNASSAPTTDDSKPPKWFADYLASEEAKKAQQQSAQQPSNVPANRQTTGEALMDAINALPEKIAGFINEAKPQQPTQSQQQSTSDTPPPGTPKGKTRQEKFRNWWFD